VKISFRIENFSFSINLSSNFKGTLPTAIVLVPLNDQSSGKKVAIFVDIRKVHEKWSIFCFYGML
jgi:hypothetical protein